MLRALPTYTAIAEPYDLLEEEGHESAEMPSLEDFELQLERSMKSLAEAGGGPDLRSLPCGHPCLPDHPWRLRGIRPRPLVAAGPTRHGAAGSRRLCPRRTSRSCGECL